MSGVLGPGNGTRSGNALVGRVMERAAIDGLLARRLSVPRRGARARRSARHRQVRAGAVCDRRRSRGFRVLRVAGVESEMALGYAGVHQLVLPILDGLRRLPEPQRDALDAVLGTDPARRPSTRSSSASPC